MTPDDDSLWQRIVADARLRARELGAAERRLAQRTGLPPMASEPYLARVMLRPVRRRVMLPAAVGLLLVLCGLGSAAWIGSPLIWPTKEQQDSLPDDYGAALLAAADPATGERRLRQVLGLLDERCAFVLRALREHSRSSPRAAAHAVRVRNELLDVLLHGRRGAPSCTQQQLLLAMQTSTAAKTADADARIDAMDGLRDAVLPGLAAVHALTARGIEVEGGLRPMGRLAESLGAIAVGH